MAPVETSLENKDENQEHDDVDEEQLCLKLHHLGRTCFRKVGIPNRIDLGKLPFTVIISISKQKDFSLTSFR